MNDWCTTTLGNISSINIGGTPSREIQKYWASNYEQGEYWVSIADLKSRIISETKEQITKEGILSSNVKRVITGTFIMSFKLSIGRSAIVGKDMYTNEAIAAIVPKGTQVSSIYLYYILPPVAKNAITDTAVKGVTLNKASLRKLMLSFPISRVRQNKIVEILQTIDQTIEKTEALIEKYQQIKAGLMHDLFTRGITADGKLRPPREQAPELYQETPIGWIPKDWGVDKFKDMTEILTCGVAATPEYVDSSVGVPFLSAQNVNKGNVVLKRFSYITQMLHKQLTKHSKPKNGDILYSRVGAGFGEAAVVEFEWNFSVYVSLTLIRMKKNYDNYFYKYLLNSNQVKNKASIDVYQGGGVPNLNVKVVRDFLLLVPSYEEQRLIAKKVKAIDQKIDCEFKGLEKLNNQKSGLMHDLLTGKVSVKVDEPEATHV